MQIPFLLPVAALLEFGATQHQMELKLDFQEPVDPYSIKKRHSVSQITFSLRFV